MPSTSIRRTKYDPDTQTLSVWFLATGKRYDYQGVPAETYAAFRNAFVKGRSFIEHIRDHFPYRRVATQFSSDDAEPNLL